MANPIKVTIRYHDIEHDVDVIRGITASPNIHLLLLFNEFPYFQAAPGIRLYKNGFPLIPIERTLTELGIKAGDEIEVRYFIRLYFRDPTVTKGAIPYWMWTGEDVGFTRRRFMEYIRPKWFDQLPPDPHFNFPGLGWLDLLNKKWYVMGVRHDDSVYIENWGPNNERVPDDQWASPDVLRAPKKPNEQVTFDDYARTFAPIYDYYRWD